MFTGAQVGVEDCLFLNVYTPRLPTELEEVRLPVMVWIHGGGFVMGEGDTTPVYAPDYLLDQQVVLVTINYRVGPFGFLTTGDEAAPGNYGMHDQVLALRWVQDNIEAFGGDPDEVTIFGESAGGSAVGLLVLSPQAEGLFARAISQSGAAFCNFAASGLPQGKHAKRHAELLGCDTSSSQSIVECLRQKPTEDIMKVLPQLNITAFSQSIVVAYKPRVDAESPVPFLPEDPYLALKNGHFNRVPWMNGMTKDEGAGSVGMIEAQAPEIFTNPDLNVWASTLLELTGVTDDPLAITKQIYSFYFGEEPVTESNKHRMGELITDRSFSSGISSEIELASAHTPVYKYILDHTGPGRRRLTDMFEALLGLPLSDGPDVGVTHGDDVMYLFKPELGAPVEPGSAQHLMVRFMVSVWTSFARDGYPSSDVLAMPRWPAYTTTEQQHMWLNSEPSVGRAAFSERFNFWKQLDIKENWRGPLSSQQRDEL